MQQEELVFTVCLQGTFTAMDDDHPIHWTKSVNIGKPLIARLDLHRAMRRNSCLQTCLMPHSPSHSPCHSPGPEHRHHLYHGSHQAQDYNRLSPQHRYLDIGEHLQGAVGGCGDIYYENLSQCRYDPPYTSGGLSSSPGRLSIPIETTDDINELQTVFINSLQLQPQWDRIEALNVCSSESILLLLLLLHISNVYFIHRLFQKVLCWPL